MIGNHYGSLIDKSGHFLQYRARSDPSLPFKTIAEQGIALHRNCKFRFIYLTINVLTCLNDRMGEVCRIPKYERHHIEKVYYSTK